MTTAPGVSQIPEHLREYITTQEPALYTPIDQAVWRYVMRVSKKFFSTHGHPLYVEGIAKTGMSTERIPLVTEMDAALRKFGWRAVAINGFIPPSIFLEFQSLKILAIACDIRKLENLGYTPSPDIIHEAAGHAPIVADPEYRGYLEAYGEVARNALISKYDIELYGAIFKLSELKEDPHSTPESIAEAEKNFAEIAARESEPSEAALLTRMAWWTTEYGLIEKNGKPVIYGAGLLSSVAESYHCLSPAVKKIPFSLKASIETSYDITRPQPQLFVTKSFSELTKALEEFAKTMAFRSKGVVALAKGKTAQHTATVALDNGFQMTGVIASHDEKGTLFTLSGIKQVSFEGKAIEEITSYNLSAEMPLLLFDQVTRTAAVEDLVRKLHGSGIPAKDGYRILGRFKKEIRTPEGQLLFLIERPRIYDAQEKLVFEEPVKTYPLTFASEVVSVFGGAGDRRQFALKNEKRSQKVNSHKTNMTPENRDLCDLYAEVREIREQIQFSVHALESVIHKLDRFHKDDWLLRLEILELFATHDPSSKWNHYLKNQLGALAGKTGDKDGLIKRGLELI